jgi:hypothetical protein
MSQRLFLRGTVIVINVQAPKEIRIDVTMPTFVRNKYCECADLKGYSKLMIRRFPLWEANIAVRVQASEDILNWHKDLLCDEQVL